MVDKMAGIKTITLDCFKLKQYKNCAGCINYRWGSFREDDFCYLGFPTEKLKQDEIAIRMDYQYGEQRIYELKPKYGCTQKIDIFKKNSKRAWDSFNSNEPEKAVRYLRNMDEKY